MILIGIVVAVALLLVAAVLYDRRAKRRGQAIRIDGKTIIDTRRDAQSQIPQPPQDMSGSGF